MGHGLLLFILLSLNKRVTEFLLEQTLMSPLNSSQLGLDSWPSMFLLYHPLLAGILLISLPRISHPQYLITLDTWLGSSSSTTLQVMSDHPGLPSARILLGQFSQNFPYS